MNPIGTGTRGIARAAVRSELARTAFELFRHHGFEKVTFEDIAAAAGVSRSTVLRYFDSKEQAALCAFDEHGEQAAEALKDRPLDEDDWTALRRAMDTVVERYRQDPAQALALARLVRETPALCGRRLEERQGWRSSLACALAQRHGLPRPTLALTVHVGAALECLNVAIEHWVDSEGSRDFERLLDKSFAAILPG